MVGDIKLVHVYASQGHAYKPDNIRIAYKAKNAKYKMYSTAGIAFAGCVMNTFGQLGPDVLRIGWKCASKAARRDEPSFCPSVVGWMWVIRAKNHQLSKQGEENSIMDFVSAFWRWCTRVWQSGCMGIHQHCTTIWCISNGCISPSLNGHQFSTSPPFLFPHYLIPLHHMCLLPLPLATLLFCSWVRRWALRVECVLLGIRLLMQHNTTKVLPQQVARLGGVEAECITESSLFVIH